MESRITKNVFCTYTGDESKADTTIFFISGNPGLISYYHPFLSLLAKHLAADQGEGAKNESTFPESGSETSFRIYGCSLGGFEVAEQSQNDPPSEQSFSSSSFNANGPQGKNESDESGPRLYDLEEQICFVQGKLNKLMRTISSGKKQKVILIGHSVGTYMAMEILRRHRENTTEPQSDGADNSPDFDIIGGIMLFPTVMDISASPSGQKLTVWLLPRPTHY
jgi:pimeloyl-ACP methyl ester carboxylesterase